MTSTVGGSLTKLRQQPTVQASEGPHIPTRRESMAESRVGDGTRSAGVRSRRPPTECGEYANESFQQSGAGAADRGVDRCGGRLFVYQRQDRLPERAEFHDASNGGGRLRRVRGHGQQDDRVWQLPRREAGPMGRNEARKRLGRSPGERSCRRLLRTVPHGEQERQRGDRGRRRLHVHQGRSVRGRPVRELPRTGTGARDLPGTRQSAAGVDRRGYRRGLRQRLRRVPHRHA